MFPDLSDKAMKKRAAEAEANHELAEQQRIKALPFDIQHLCVELSAQAELLIEMDQTPEFCRRLLELFEMQKEMAASELLIDPQIIPTFEEFWAGFPEAQEATIDQVTIARMRHIAHRAFERKMP